MQPESKHRFTSHRLADLPDAINCTESYDTAMFIVTIYRGPKFWQFILVLALKATISFPASLVQTNTDFHANFLFGPQPWIWLKSLGKLQSTKKISRALKG